MKLRLEHIQRFDRINWFVEACELHEGQSFGETALISEGPRNASLMAITNCELAVLKKVEFERVLEKIM